jgi:hypothetical protein
MFSANLPEMLPFSAACEARLFYQPFAARLKLFSLMTSFTLFGRKSYGCNRGQEKAVAAQPWKKKGLFPLSLATTTAIYKESRRSGV